jgi:hypothetical protein
MADMSKGESIMTENELRSHVVATAEKWLGCKESNGTHKPIIDLYNSHKPLARSYPVKYTDAWCATYVSAVAIACGLTDIMPTECSCSQMVQLYKKRGRWQESDNYVPKLGDVVMYDWGDSGSGDNTGRPDHVGIVAFISGNSMKIIEGNISNSVAYRALSVNGKYIRGFCLPDYASKADGVTNSNTNSNTTNTAPSNTNSNTPTYKPTVATTYYSVRLPLLKYGSEIPAVKTMQQLLLAKGYNLPKYGADGDFGEETEVALKAYQRANNLEVDGKCGANTWGALITK